MNGGCSAKVSVFNVMLSISENRRLGCLLGEVHNFTCN